MTEARAQARLVDALRRARALISGAVKDESAARLAGDVLGEIDRLVATFDPAVIAGAPLTAPLEPHVLPEASVESLRREIERLKLTAERDRRLLVLVLEQSPHGVIICDERGRFVMQNRAAERIWAGSATTESIEDWGRYRAYHPDGRPYTAHDWSMVRSLTRRETIEAEEVHFQRFDGSHGVLLGSCAPLIDRDGQLLGAVLVFADITALKQTELELVRANESAARILADRDAALAEAEAAQRRLAFLAEASATLSATLDEQTGLTNLSRLIVPTLADWCAIHVVEEDGSVRRVAGAHADPKRAPLIEALQRRYGSLDRDTGHTLLRVLDSGRSWLVPDIPPARLADHARDAAHLQLLRELGFRSVMAVPMVARERTLGTISFVYGHSGRRHTQADLALAEELGRRAALAVDNARLYREAQRAIRLRDDFLSIAAHELKTPITSLRGFAQLLLRRLERDGALDPDRTRGVLETLDQQSLRLARLVEQLLDVTRMEAGRLRLDRHRTDVAGLVRATVRTAQAGAERHRLEVAALGTLIASIDALRLEQVLTNLLDNAIKYSPEGGRIKVEVATAGETLRIAVRDWGIGIPPERRPHIFDRFYQAHEAGAFGGVGLGLYISRQIVELHEGRLEAEFPEDGGTRFVVTLPITPPATGSPQPSALARPLTAEG